MERTHTAGGPVRRRHRRHGREALDTLAAARRGNTVRIMSIDDEDARVHALRFGMGEGSTVSCVTALPAGPVIVRAGRQEIAIGRHLARRIRIEPAAVA